MSSSCNQGCNNHRETWMSDVFGKFLLQKIEGAITSYDTSTLLPESNRVLGVFFSALWCPPCEQFLKDLIIFYSNIRKCNADFEIIFISSDKDEKLFRQYFSEMPWLAIPFTAHEIKQKLTKRFSVDSIPTLVLIDSSGSVITRKGREKIYGDPLGLTFPWRQRSLLDELGNQFYLSATNQPTADVIVPLKTITTVNITDPFKNERYLALYFSARWCAPCQPFTRVLTNYCRSLRERQDLSYDLQVIVCSMDLEEEEFQKHFLSMPDNWLAIPYYEKWRVEALTERFSVENIPRVVIIAPDTSILNLSARKMIEADLTGAGFPDSLSSPLIENLAVTTKSFGFDLNLKPALLLFMEFSTTDAQAAVLEKVEQFALKFAKNKAATPDGPDILFFISTRSSPIGQKIRALVGLPWGVPVSNEDEMSQIWDIVNGNSSISGRESITSNGHLQSNSNESSVSTEPTDAIEGVIKEYHGNSSNTGYYRKHDSNDTNCGDGLCLTDVDDGKNDREEVKRGREKEFEELKDENEYSSCDARNNEEVTISMDLVILDVPDGGVYYKYVSQPLRDPNASSTFAPALKVPTMIGGGNYEKSMENFGGEKSYPDRESSGRAPLAAFVEVEHTGHDGNTSTIKLSNVEEITRNFIADYQMGKLMRRKLGGLCPGEF